MKILYAASEAAPYLKTGGLGDVAYSFPKALSAAPGAEIYVFLPYYKAIKENPDFEVEFVVNFEVPLSWRHQYAGVFKAVSRKKKLQYYFIDNEYYFYRDKPYGYYDDGERFSFFSKAVLEALQHLGWYPDVLHANDWQTAMMPVFLRAFYDGLEEYRKIRTLFTIHNIEYQGKAPDSFSKDVLGMPDDWENTMHYDGCTNMMKAAIVTADRVSTVSRTYAYEIQEEYFAYGLHQILRENSYKLCGVVNGIDIDLFSPVSDRALYVNYSSAELEKKIENKRFLQQKLSLAMRDEAPLVAVISRLVKHKGMELISRVMPDLMNEDIQMVVVGTGDYMFEEMFRQYAAAFPHKMSANILFDGDLASQTYAGADMILIPSKQEPCGLTQLIAMRYGTVPIVRETGGLFDTVPALNPETMEGRGFTFKSYNAHDMLDAVRRAAYLKKDTEKWNLLMRNIMEYDSSWRRPVEEYWQIYKNMV